MNEIINIQIVEGKVNARELHGELKIGRRFTTWIQGRIEEYGFEKGVDFVENTVFSQNGEKLGRPSIEYSITLGMAKELAMLEKNEVGRRVRKYFIKCEENLIKASTLGMIPEEMYLEAKAELTKKDEQIEDLKADVKELEEVNEYQAKTISDQNARWNACFNDISDYATSKLTYKKNTQTRKIDVYNHYCRTVRASGSEPRNQKEFYESLLLYMVDGKPVVEDGAYYLNITIK